MNNDTEKTAVEPVHELTVNEQKLIDDFRLRNHARHSPPKVKIEHIPGELVHLSYDGKNKALQRVNIMTAFGTTSKDFYDRSMHQLLEAGCNGTNKLAFEESDVNGAIAAMHGIAPRDETEAMLAAQMVATHTAAMRAMRHLKGCDTIPQQDSNGNLAIKLLRTYKAQLEALQRYRSKGQQKMTVEHVHVYPGAQVIVGTVNQSNGGRAGNKKSLRNSELIKLLTIKRRITQN